MISGEARARSTKQASRLGFTLVELMVALAIGGVAITSIYAVGKASTRHFREQQRVSNTQTAVRMAMDQLKRDLQRAGYLGTPRALVQGESCQTPTYTGAPVAAISDFGDDVGSPALADACGGINTGSGEVTFDRVVLMGNYSTSGEYAIGTGNTSTSVTVGHDWQSFRRDFNNWENDTFVPALFTEAFMPGRMVRIHTQSDSMFFTSIGTGGTTTGADPTVGVTPAIPNTCTIGGGWISPLNSIVYEVQAATADEAARYPVANGPVAVLRRFEAVGNDHTAVLPRPGGGNADSRSVLDYVVSFNLRFRSSNGLNQPNTVSWAQTAPVNVGANPEYLRSVIIDVAARTPEQEPEMAVRFTAPLSSFTVFAQPGSALPGTCQLNQRPGAARVRSARAEVFLPNIAFRGY